MYTSTTNFYNESDCEINYVDRDILSSSTPDIQESFWIGFATALKVANRTDLFASYTEAERLRRIIEGKRLLK